MSNLQAPKPAAKNEAESSISLGEGQTPLLLSRHIGPSVGLSNLYFKLETVNPSGSYKDRFAAAAISLMLKEGKKRCLATSSGNTGSALAAYCAAAGMSCEIVILETTPNEKLKQMAAYGAKLFKVRGFGPQPDVTQRVFARLQQMGNCGDCALQISAYCYSPGGMAGIETISSELAAQLSSGIDHVCVPAGGGGLTLSIARGFERLPSGFSRPRIHCVQPEGNDTIASAIRSGASKARSVTCTTKISGLQVSNVLDGNEVIAACRKSGGNGYLVTDIAVWEMQRRMAREEGIFCEPAAAVALAGALNAFAAGEIRADERVVCIVTGIGFKDLHAIDKITANSQCPVLELSQFEEMLR
ncbi:MAG TPA: pyridoxal-phosphate dependent enzyme [Tepidisphaeraceae bacterium]|jgi:threonine synthase|nr:pyridoxal-phosphate dependent enzyme [Tepidisphaeraceae bacterium]